MMSRVIALITIVLAAWLGGGAILSEGLGGAALASGANLDAKSGNGPVDAGHSKEGADTRKKGGPDQSPLFFENLTIPVLRNQQVARHVSLSFTLEPSSPEAEKTIIDGMPRLRHAYVVDLMGYLRLVNIESNPTAGDAIRARLMLITERTLGPGLLKTVYIARTTERVF